MKSPLKKITSLIEIPLNKLIEISVAWWRFNRWLARYESDRSLVVARNISHKLEELLKECHIEIIDIENKVYDPGLAVEIIDIIEDPDLIECDGIIDETITPIIMFQGTVLKQGQIVLRRRPGKQS